MKKQIKKTEYAFSCDICGKLINDRRPTFGRYEPASEIVKVCYICGKDTCPDCHSYIDSIISGKGYTICSECQVKTI